MYAQLSELGITFFSIAHRLVSSWQDPFRCLCLRIRALFQFAQELMKFHQAQLHFAADGTGRWTLTPLDESGAPIANGAKEQ